MFALLDIFDVQVHQVPELLREKLLKKEMVIIVIHKNHVPPPFTIWMHLRCKACQSERK